MSRTVLKFNRLPEIQRQLPPALAECNETAAEELCEVLQRALDDGSEGIQSDTHALALSLYVKATGRSDYEEALSAAREAFITHPSRYRENQTEKERKASFEKIKADFEPLPKVPEHVALAAVSTMLAYGNKWEFEVNWMENPAMEWAYNRVGPIIADHLKNALS